MKHVLEFEGEEREAFTLAFRGADYYAVLTDLDGWLRAEVKYQDLSMETASAYAVVRARLRELLDERGLALL